MLGVISGRLWLACKLLLGGLLIWQLFGCVLNELIPVYSAKAETPSGRARIALDLYPTSGPFSEYRMVLRFAGPGGSSTIEPLIDTGGHTRMSLYTTPTDNIVVLGTASRDFFFDSRTGAVRPLRERLEVPLIYIGAFDFVRLQGTMNKELRLLTPAESPECIATMATWAEPGPNRSSAYRLHC